MINNLSQNKQHWINKSDTTDIFGTKRSFFIGITRQSTVADPDLMDTSIVSTGLPPHKNTAPETISKQKRNTKHKMQQTLHRQTVATPLFTKSTKTKQYTVNTNGYIASDWRGSFVRKQTAFLPPPPAQSYKRNTLFYYIHSKLPCSLFELFQLRVPLNLNRLIFLLLLAHPRWLTRGAQNDNGHHIQCDQCPHHQILERKRDRPLLRMHCGQQRSEWIQK